MKKFAYVLMAGTFVSGLAQAQTVDYGVLESIFGEPVTTSATGKPQRVSEAPVAMKIITAEEIRRSGAKDIPQILQRVAGVEVRKAAIGSSDVTLRGFNQPMSNRILVLIDGRQVLEDGFGHVPWGQLPVQMNEIRQIEVVKGPNSSLFGFNAEQGVINIITFSPLKDDVDVANVKFGNRQHQEMSLVNTMKLADNQALRFSAGVLHSDGFNRDNFTGNSITGSGIPASDDTWSRMTQRLDYEYQIDGNKHLRAEITHLDGTNDVAIPFGGLGSWSNYSRSAKVDYKQQSDYGLWDISAYRNSYNTRSSTTGWENDLNVLKIQNLFKYGSKHAFRLAGEYRYNSLKGNITGAAGGAKFESDLFAPSAMWDWKVSPKLSWTNSVRYDHVDFGRNIPAEIGSFSGSTEPFSRKIEEISFNSGLVYNLNAKDKLRFSVARGLHIPSLIEMGSGADLTPTPAGFIGDPTLQTERNLTVEFGYNTKLEDDTNVGASVFWSRLENLLAPDIVPGVPTSFFAFQEAGDSEAVGVELEAEGLYKDWLNWGANYTYMWVKDEDGFTALTNEGNQPKHQVSVYGGFDFADNWEFNSDLHYISGTNQRYEAIIAADQEANEYIDGYFILNARVGYNYNDNTTVSIDGYNLIDRHREYYNQAVAIEDNGGAVIGRSILLNMNHRF